MMSRKYKWLISTDIPSVEVEVIMDILDTLSI